MKIFACHLQNDYSGSPKVLMQLLKGWTASGQEVHLLTGKNRKGFLSHIEGVNYHYFWHQATPHKWLHLLYYCVSQLLLFVQLWRIVSKEDVIYINTVLPFGAALLGKLFGCRVFYHVHETSVQPTMLHRFLLGTVRWTATEVICVSKYLAAQEDYADKPVHILPNAIEPSFLATAKTFQKEFTSSQNILMVCSLKDYKGVKEFVKLAAHHPKYQFRLVLNASKEDIDLYFAEIEVTANLAIFPTQTNLHTFYQWAAVIVNLSRPDGWIETFGLTIIEGMAYGLPAIVPPVGGITELIDEGVNGYQIDCRDTALLNRKLCQILDHPAAYDRMSAQAMNRIAQFQEGRFIQKNLELLNNDKKEISPEQVSHLLGFINN